MREFPPVRLEDEEEEDKPDSMGKLVMEKLLEARTIMITRPITDKLAEKIYTQLAVLENLDESKPITVIINSPGGHADSGFGIYDMLRFCKCPIRSVVAGMCASAAVPPFVAGEKGQRYSLPNSRFLLHQPSTKARGDASDILITSKEINKLKVKYNEIMAEATGQTAEKIAEDADRDFWLSPAEAVEYGLVDKVITHRAEME